MAWSNLVEALLLITGGLVLLGVWASARRRDRRATQALRVSEERFRHLTTLSADWFWETDAAAPHQLALGRPGGGGAVRRRDGARPPPVGGARRGRRAARAGRAFRAAGRAGRADAVLRFPDLAQRRGRTARAPHHRQAALRRGGPVPRLPRRRQRHHREAARRARAEPTPRSAWNSPPRAATWRSGTSTWAPTRCTSAAAWPKRWARGARSAAWTCTSASIRPTGRRCAARSCRP